MPALAEYGQQLFPEAHFYSDDEAYAGHQYDLVMASGALQYNEDWRAILPKLVNATGRYLYVTRIPIVRDGASFVVLQRAYQTQYLSWHLNRDEFLQAAAADRLELLREFLINENLIVDMAPARTFMRGFLFKPARNQ